MAAGACGDRDQPVGALFDRLVGEAVVDDVVQRQPAIAVHGRIDVLAGAERRDDDRRLPLDRQRHILFEPRVGLVDDLVDREWGGGAFRMGAIMRGQRLGDFVQPFVELGNGAGVEGGKSADDSGLALGDHQRRMRDDEQRRADDGQSQVVFKNVRQRHRCPRDQPVLRDRGRFRSASTHDPCNRSHINRMRRRGQGRGRSAFTSAPSPNRKVAFRLRRDRAFAPATAAASALRRRAGAAD